MNTSVTSTVSAKDLVLFPNPTEDILNVVLLDASGSASARIHDVAGKQVMTTAVRGGRLDVSTLRPGIYSLVLTTPSGSFQRTFSKR